MDYIVCSPAGSWLRGSCCPSWTAGPSGLGHRTHRDRLALKGALGSDSVSLKATHSENGNSL